MFPPVSRILPLFRVLVRASLLPLSLSLTACSSDDGGSDETGGDGDGDGDSDGDRTFEEQVEDGAALYGEHCATCHGAAGEGTVDGPQVVGDGALPLDPPEERMFRTEQFETALDVFLFASEAMPGDDPGSLSDAEMVDILAFALFANGVTLEEPLSGANAGDIVINAAD